MDLKRRAARLTDELLAAQKAYYVDGRPIMSDLEYDARFDELVRIERAHPELRSDTSPTNRVGSDLTGDFPEVSHTIPVLSLDKAYSAQEVVSWMDKTMKSASSRLSFVEEEKIDGISIVLYYEDGLFVRALTRGNGYVGNDVSENIKTIRAVPLRLASPVTLAVRGEVYLAKKDFERLKEADPEVANPRNMAAGAVRRQKSSETAAIPLTIFVYEGFWSDEGETPANHLAILAELRRLGFRINPHLALFSSSREESERLLAEAGIEARALEFGDLASYLEEITLRRSSLEYEIDGMVTKVNELDVREALGYTEHHPRWAIAYKFESPQAVTKVLGVTVQVGRTGRITPVAELEPVALGGSTVRRATLHNQEYIDELELAIGDSVSVVKRGDVIPAVEEVLEKNGEGNTTFVIPSTCPTCSSVLEKRGAHLFCPNRQCPDQVKGRIAFFTARDQMDMDSIGPKAIAKLYDMGLVKDIPDLYTCDYDRLVGEKGYGEKMVRAFKDAVEDSKNRPFATVLASLGLPEVGGKGAEILVKGGFDSMDKLLKASDDNDVEAFTRIPQIGPQTANLIIAALQDEDMRGRIRRLEEAGLQFSQKQESSSLEQIFQGQVWAVTGSFEHFNPRTLALKELEKRGARTVSSVTGKTTHLLAGKGGGSKRQSAQALGVEIVDEARFLSMLGWSGDGDGGKEDDGDSGQLSFGF